MEIRETARGCQVWEGGKPISQDGLDRQQAAFWISCEERNRAKGWK